VPEGGGELFVHYTSVSGGGFRTLVEGETVEYEVGPGPHGEQAVNVLRVKPR
jgi:CspA family cold shock protein